MLQLLLLLSAMQKISISLTGRSFFPSVICLQIIRGKRKMTLQQAHRVCCPAEANTATIQVFCHCQTPALLNYAH